MESQDAVRQSRSENDHVEEKRHSKKKGSEQIVVMKLEETGLSRVVWNMFVKEQKA